MNKLNTPVLITGCQRSGTTLLNLILDSHPQTLGLDEAGFKRETFHQAMQDPRFTHVALKLPTIAAKINSFKSIPGLKIVWMMRDPRDVVLSMLQLTGCFAHDSVTCWANHEEGAQAEIESALGALGQQALNSEHFERFKEIQDIPGRKRTRDHGLFLAALCWEIKQSLLKHYNEEGLSYRIIHYEPLVKGPKETLTRLARFIELPWHDNLLNHHRLQQGISIGNTVNTRPIDGTNTQKWLDKFSDQDLILIREVCHNNAAVYGYAL